MLQLPANAEGKASPRAPRKAIDRTGDEKLWALHDAFCDAYADLLSLDTEQSRDGSLSNSPPVSRRAYRAWMKQIDVADAAARKVIEAPANTVNGMLMKIHIAGFNFTYAGKSFSAPYHGLDVKPGKPQAWTFSKRDGCPIEDEEALIVSLRSDLHRMKGKR